MRNSHILTLTFVFKCLMACQDEDKAQTKSDWFIKNLEQESKRREVKYDFKVSQAFLTKHKGTASFSPICSDLNILLQVANGEFGEDNVVKGIKHFYDLLKKVKNIDSNIFSIANCFYKNNEITEEYDYSLGYLFKLFSLNDAKLIFEEHSEWVKKETKGLLSTPIKQETFENKDRIYASVVYFKDCWNKAFEKKLTYKADFTLSDDTIQERDFMHREASFKYAKVVDTSIQFHFVAVPYKEYGRGAQSSRFMVYLIPFDNKTCLLNLWDVFFNYYEKNICRAILDLDEKYFDFSIPKIEKLISSFNTKDILSDIFKHSNVYSVHSKMLTYLNVDEEGTEASAIMISDCTDSIAPETEKISANVPHLSFIYDTTTKRIFFITQDLGGVKNK